MAGTLIMRLSWPVRPLPAQLDVAGHALVVRQRAVRIFQQRIELEAHIAVVALRCFPHRQKHFLRVAHDAVGQLPGRFLVAQPLFAEQRVQLVVEAARLDQVGNDDRVRRRAGGARARGWLAPGRGPPSRATAWCRWRSAIEAVMPLLAPLRGSSSAVASASDQSYQASAGTVNPAGDSHELARLGERLRHYSNSATLTIPVILTVIPALTIAEGR